MARNSNSPEIKINPDTPIWGIAQLMEFISKNSNYKSEYSEIIIAQNPNSGYIYAWSEDWSHALVADLDGKCYCHFTLPYSGIEFFEYEFEDVEYSELNTEDILSYIDILQNINTSESRDLAEKLLNDDED